MKISKRTISFLMIILTSFIFVFSGFILFENSKDFQNLSQEFSNYISKSISFFKIEVENSNENKVVLKTKKISLDNFLINVSHKRSYKIMKINVDLEVFSDSLVRKIKKDRERVREIILLMLSSKTYNQILNSESKIKIENEIKNQLNLLLYHGQIYSVQFNGKLYQKDRNSFREIKIYDLNFAELYQNETIAKRFMFLRLF